MGPVGIGVPFGRVASFSNKTIVVCAIGGRRLWVRIDESMINDVEVIGRLPSDKLAFRPVRVTICVVHHRPPRRILRWFQDDVARNTEETSFNFVVRKCAIPTKVDVVGCMGLYADVTSIRDIHTGIATAKISVDAPIRGSAEGLNI